MSAVEWRHAHAGGSDTWGEGSVQAGYISRKINLSVGAFRDAEKTVGASFRPPGRLALPTTTVSIKYLPVEGYAPFRQRSAEFALSKASKAIQENRVCSVQSLSGTGSLRVAAETLKRIFGVDSVWIPTGKSQENFRQRWHEGLHIYIPRRRDRNDSRL